MSDFATVTSDGVTVTSSTETAEQLTEILKPSEPEKTEGAETVEEQPKETDPKLAKAAAKLGQKGGEATAAKRAAATEAQEVEAEGAEAETVEAEKLGKPRHDAKARMLEATRKEAEAKRELERERTERARLSAELEQYRKTTPAKEEARPAASGKPKLEDFGTYEEFVEAVADWKADQRFERYQKEATENARATARHQGVTNAIKTHIGRFSEAAKADPTFTERTAPLMSEIIPSFELSRDARGNPVGLTASHVLADEIINSEQGPALTLYLQDHRDEFRRITALRSPLDVQRAVAKLEGRLERAEAPEPPKQEVSRAKPPVRPVAGSPHSSSEPDPDSASFDEHLSFYNRKDQQRAARN